MIASRKNAALEMRRDNSRNFISDYLMDLKLREVSATEDAEAYDTSSDGILTPPRPFNGDLREGQIRLLSQPSELTYAVLLRRWGENAFVVAPFSRFPSPATDEELKTVFDGGLYLRVIQVWNIRTALDATLRKSWLVGELPQQDIEDAWKVWEWTLGGAELAESILRRTGLPVSLKSDPRNQYMQEELEKFAAFDAEDEANAEKAESLLSARPSFTGIWVRAHQLGLHCRVADEIPMSAAAASVTSNASRTFLVAGSPARLRGEYSKIENALLFSAWDKKRRMKSDVLDGFGLLVEGADEVVPIRGNFAKCHVSKPHAEFALLDPDGNVVETSREPLDKDFDDDVIHIEGFGGQRLKPKDMPFDAISFQDDLTFPDAGLDAGFYPTSTLLSILGDSSFSLESQALSAAELLVRDSLLKGSAVDIRSALDAFLGPAVMSRFTQMFRNFEDNADDVRPEDVLRTLRGVQGERILCDRLRPVLEADGFIPLVLNGVDGRPACLLPFSFEPASHECDKGIVLDWHGAQNDVWSSLFMERLPDLFVQHGISYSIRLALVAEGRFKSMPINGESFMLSVFVAWARFCGKLPRYNVFRLFATGEVLPNGELRRVETEGKWSLISSIPDARLLAPDAGNAGSQDCSGVIPEGTNVRSGLPSSIVEKVEEWFVSDWKYAVTRLADQGLVSEINHGRYGGWNRMIDRLEHLSAPLAGDDVRERLLTEMWLGQACCHAARTDAAMKHNRTAHKLAAKVPEYRYELQRLDVEMIVNLTDKEAFDEVGVLSKSLEKELLKDDWKDKSQQADLSMRWHGSLGQALAYGSLDGHPGFSAKDAKTAFENALEDACRRKSLNDAEDPKADTSLLDADIVQDANYVHLWYALFKPSSKAAAAAYEDAKRRRRRLESRSAPRRANEVYQLRQLALAAYRRLLSGEKADAILAEMFKLESEISFVELVEDQNAESWLRATVAKYIGALMAASGDAEKAHMLFGKAASLLPVEKVKSIPGNDGKIFRKIAMTIRAEAYRSLRDSLQEESVRYLSEAKALLDGVPDRDGRWRVWLEAPDSTPFPGLSYWY